MDAQTWPEEWNDEEGTLFAAANEFGWDFSDAPVLEPVLAPALEDLERLAGYRSNQRGAWAELMVDVKVTELGGTTVKPPRDDLPYDRMIYFDEGEGKTAQIKFAGLHDGVAKFRLGERVGANMPSGDHRKWLPARKRADVFILVTTWPPSVIVPRFYVIPSGRLAKRSSLIVTPRRTRRRRGGIEPEFFVDAWKHCTSHGRKELLVSIFEDPVGSSKASLRIQLDPRKQNEVSVAVR